MSENRDTAFSFEVLLNSFNELRGYYDLNNSDLGLVLKSWNLQEESSRGCSDTIKNYQKWSFSVSFLQLINSWQWLFSGVLLSRQAYLPAQVMQMYYYSTFFSYGSFLSGQFRGKYTIEKKEDQINVKDGQIDIRRMTPNRKEVWLEDKSGDTARIQVKKQGKGGEHEVRAKWFYTVFGKWDFKDCYPEVSSFDDDKTIHSRFRNLYTYSLGDIAEELYCTPETRDAVSNDVLIALWNRGAEEADYFPEVFWALEYIKVSVDFHTRLLEKYEEGSPYGQQQISLIKSLCAHHKSTGLLEVLQTSMPAILQSIE